MTGFWNYENIEDVLCSTFLSPTTSAMDFLHGHCAVLSIALHEAFGYKIFFVADRYYCEEFEDFSLNNLIHVFCIKDGEFIDIRGKTEDEDLFMEEFDDFFTEYLILPTTAEEVREHLIPLMGGNFQEVLDIAHKFVIKHKEIYA